MNSDFDIRRKRIPIEVFKINEGTHLHGKVRVSFNYKTILINSNYLPGIQCKLREADKFNFLNISIKGPKDSPFENGTFTLTAEFGEQFPFHPPIIKFVTPVYHPNIDLSGNICLNVLKMPSAGSYNPTHTLESLLLSIQLLLAVPNPQDPLRSDIAEVYKYNRDLYNQTAEEQTRIFATVKKLKRKHDEI